MERQNWGACDFVWMIVFSALSISVLMCLNTLDMSLNTDSQQMTSALRLSLWPTNLPWIVRSSSKPLIYLDPVPARWVLDHGDLCWFNEIVKWNKWKHVGERVENIVPNHPSHHVSKKVSTDLTNIPHVWGISALCFSFLGHFMTSQLGLLPTAAATQGGQVTSTWRSGFSKM